MPILLSEELGLKNQLDEHGVFDPILEFDSNYFINIKRLQVTKVSEFRDSYIKINEYFRKIALLLSVSNKDNDKAYRTALELFNFSEVNDIGLGFSKGKPGSGFGEELKNRIIRDAKEIIKLGSNEPEIFHLLGLFEDNVGPDRLSDMIATIIYEDIYNYTLNVFKLLNINSATYPKYKFDVNGLMYNPYRPYKVLLLPKDILHELPIARCWDDIERVCAENNTIRAEINSIIGDEWRKLSTSRLKSYIRSHIFMNPSKLKQVINDYKETSVGVYDFEEDPVGDYLVSKLIFKLTEKNPLDLKEVPKNSMDIALTICKKVKDLIENNKGSEILFDNNGKPRRENVAQRMFFFIASSYCESNNLDISPESDAGRGPVDFKMSRGLDKTIVEIKLTSNTSAVHGYTTQIEEYAKAEKTQNKILLLIDNGKGSKRVSTLLDIHREAKTKFRDDENIKIPELIIIDANPKDSASKYNK
ncbi:hypothetical protein ACR77J_16690 [Tissierella praeacuta]|uniref:hypothetical protein n=1 Tax=Tissierella praeacuta TaxID=43131 RepID=UPI003DA3860B